MQAASESATAAAMNDNSSSSSSNAAATMHVTKDNIAQLTFYEIFRLDAPVGRRHSSSSSSAEDAADVVIDTAALRRAYRRYSLVFHPDKDASPAARAAFERVTLALETLSDDVKRRAYDATLREAAAASRQDSSSSGGGATASADAAMTRQQRAAEDEARRAAHVLSQREQSSAAQRARARHDAATRAAAAAQMRNELTQSLHTPAHVMEQELVREWNVDADLLAMKQRDVTALLRKLAALHEEQPSVHHSSSSSRVKRMRCDDV